MQHSCESYCTPVGHVNVMSVLTHTLVIVVHTVWRGKLFPLYTAMNTSSHTSGHNFDCVLVVSSDLLPKMKFRKIYHIAQLELMKGQGFP